MSRPSICLSPYLTSVSRTPAFFEISVNSAETVEEAFAAWGRLVSNLSQSFTDFGKFDALSSAFVTSARNSFNFLASSDICCGEAPAELAICHLYPASAMSAATSKQTPAMIVLFWNVKSRLIKPSYRSRRVRTHPHLHPAGPP